jgi:hypothetical protein
MGDEYMAAVEWLWCDDRRGVPLVIRPRAEWTLGEPHIANDGRLAKLTAYDDAGGVSFRVDGGISNASSGMSGVEIFGVWLAGGFFVGSLLGFIAYMNI